MQVGSLELFYSQAPDAMRSTCSALQLVATACGNYLAAALVGIVQSISNGSWIADNLNQAHIDYFFFLLAVLQVSALGPTSLGLRLGSAVSRATVGLGRRRIGCGEGVGRVCLCYCNTSCRCCQAELLPGTALIGSLPTLDGFVNCGIPGWGLGSKVLLPPSAS